MLEKLNPNDFPQIFALMAESFPKDEYRPYQEQKTLMEKPEYQIYTLKNPLKDEIQAFIAIWEFVHLAFIEHFAVSPSCRYGGLGSKILNQLTAQCSKLICLEAELEETSLAKRRIEFYKRNNFYLNNYTYIMPPVSKGQKPVQMHIMTYGRPVSKEEFDAIKSTLYSKVYNAV